MENKYISYINEHFSGRARDLLLRQVKLFFTDTEIIKNKYKVGDKVFLKKGTYIHGIPGLIESFDWIIDNGFIGNEFTNQSCANKIKASIGMWDIQEDKFLSDYINEYSGFTITYTIGRGPGSKEISELIPYHKFDEVTEELNNREDVWMWWGDQTKEVRFIPSLVANKRQIAFILNMDSAYAKELSSNDVWNKDLDEDVARDFIDYRYYDKFLKDRLNRNASTTDRESAIMFGVPTRLIEGVFVGRDVEKSDELLKYIKSKLEDCYICNLDGKVIVE